MDFHSHAVSCGIDMTNREAIPIVMCDNRINAIDILHPEDQELIVPAGFRLNYKAYSWLQDAGVDYVVVEK